MATPHISSNKEDIASVVLMPGDPLRAKYIADHFLKDVKLVNSVRNMTAYTGFYKDKKVTVFPSGMGIPSIGIYAYELYKFYNVDTIIRVGSCGTYKEHLDLFDIILVDKSYSESNFAKTYLGIDTNEAKGSEELNNKIKETSIKLNKKVEIGNVYCSEAFYSLVEKESNLIKEKNCLAVEMESYALFHIANSLGKKASTILTVSDSLVTKKETTSLQREQGFSDMILLTLESIL